MGAHSLVGQEAWGSFNDGAVLDAAGYVSINTTFETANAPVTVNVGLTDSTGVTVEYGHTSNDRDYLVDDENWISGDNLGVLPTNEYVVLRLTSELGIRGWYKFRIRTGRMGNSLVGITINGGQVSPLPAVNTEETGSAAVNYTMTGPGPWETVNVTAALDSASGGATITYAVASSTNIPVWGFNLGTFQNEIIEDYEAGFTSPGSFTNVALGHYVVIRVVSENGENTGYYKVRLVFGDAVNTLSAITINSGSIETLPEPNVTAGGDIAGRHQMSVAGPWTSVTVGVTTDSEKATVAYASAPAVNTSIADAEWSDSGTLSNIQSGQYVFIRVTSEAGTVNYYKIRLVYGSSEAALTSVTIGGAAVSLGSPGSISEFYGSYMYMGVPGTVRLTAEQAGDGSTVTVAATPSEGATVRYNWGGGIDFGFGMSYYLSGAANWNTTGQGLFNGGTAGYVTVNPGVNGALIFIEVTSQDGTAVNTYAVTCAVGE
jgi:hypothetical protein